MFEISKEFSFDYGHRVHTQKLKVSHSLDNQCVCRHLHGHRGSITISLIGEELEDTQMLTDFKHLNWVKKLIDEGLDHKMILDIKDPLVQNGFYLEIMKVREEFGGGLEVNFGKLKEIDNLYYIVKPEVYSHVIDEYKELYEGLVFVDFCPTSENFAKWIHGIVKEKMSQFVNITSLKVQFSETPKTTATYYE